MRSWLLFLIVEKKPPTRSGSFALGYRLGKRTCTRGWFFLNNQNKNHYKDNHYDETSIKSFWIDTPLSESVIICSTTEPSIWSQPPLGSSGMGSSTNVPDSKRFLSYNTSLWQIAHKRAPSSTTGPMADNCGGADDTKIKESDWDKFDLKPFNGGFAGFLFWVLLLVELDEFIVEADVWLVYTMGCTVDTN